MPLIDPEDKTPQAKFECRLRTDEILDIQLYAKAIDSSPDYVVAQALRKLFGDKEFQSWKEANKAEAATLAILAAPKEASVKRRKARKEAGAAA